ncbi:MAG: tyrosine-type recombinase/integrase [Vampirovibrionales bacterium]
MGYWKEAAHLFVEYLLITRDASSHTLRAYGREMDAWLKALALEMVDCGVAFETSHSSALWREWALLAAVRCTKGLKTSSQRRFYSTLRSFIRYAVRHQGLEAEWLTLSFPKARLAQGLPQFLTAQEVEALIAALASEGELIDCAENDSYSNCLERALCLRNQAIIGVLFTAGLRVNELTQLRWGDIDWEESSLRVQGKGNRQRVAFVSDETLASLKAYEQAWIGLLQRHRGRFKQSSDCRQTKPLPSDPIWLNHTGRLLSARSVARMLAQVAQKTGYSQAVHPHVFRHSFATHLLNHGVELRMVQELLGHVSIRSTQIYTHLQTHRLRQAYQKAHPRALR